MAVTDTLGLLRAGGSAPAVTATEAGSVSLTRDGTTGKVVLQVDKTAIRGIPLYQKTGADGGTSTDKVLTTTIEACDSLDFSSTEVDVIATFDPITHGDAAAFQVRRVTTQKTYMRSVITLTGSDGTISVDHEIGFGEGLIETES